MASLAVLSDCCSGVRASGGINSADAECGACKARRARALVRAAFVARPPPTAGTKTHLCVSFVRARQVRPPAGDSGDCRRSQVRGRARRSPARSTAARRARARATRRRTTRPIVSCHIVRHTHHAAIRKLYLFLFFGARRCLRGGGSSGGRTGVRYGTRHPSRTRHTTPACTNFRRPLAPRPPVLAQSGVTPPCPLCRCNAKWTTMPSTTTPPYSTTSP